MSIKKYEICEDLCSLEEIRDRLIATIEEQLILADKYVHGAGREEMGQAKKIIDDFSVWLKDRIKEKYKLTE